MVLVYMDESGINYNKSEGFWVDGPYAVWSSILVPENKYFHVERMYYDLINKLLGIRDWRKTELYATNIWAHERNFSNISKIRIQEYFEELFQMLCKFHLRVVVGVQQKNPRLRTKASEKKEIQNSIYALLHNLEYRLSEIEEVGVLIADMPGETSLDPLDYSNIQKILFDKSKWRYNPTAKSNKPFKTIFNFESRTCFLLDQIHHSDSKTSFFLQLADHVAFVIQRVLTYRYLKSYPAKNKPLPDINKVPVSPEPFRFFVKESNMSIAYIDKKRDDVTFISSDHLAEYHNPTQGFEFISASLLPQYTPYK